MRKKVNQLIVGDYLRFAGNWHRVRAVGMGTEVSYIYFDTYPPVIVRMGDTFECKEGKADQA